MMLFLKSYLDNLVLISAFLLLIKKILKNFIKNGKKSLDFVNSVGIYT